MREAVIVSTARTPIGRAYRGAFNATPSSTLGGHAVAEAVKRAGIAGEEVEDVVIGAAMQRGAGRTCPTPRDRLARQAGRREGHGPQARRPKGGVGAN